MREKTIALAGNPNSGKTTLFNSFTGARQHVGNYPGVTVEKKEGFYIHNDNRFKFVDLPGTYSLTAYSLEEIVARDFLVNEKPSAVINIVDAANLERNLYLTIQFLEMGIPVILSLNMIDVAEKRGITIDSEKLSRLLGVPVIATIARRGEGKQELAEVAERIIGNQVPYIPIKISYGEDVDQTLLDMEKVIEKTGFLTDLYPPRWIALKYMENDEQIQLLGREKDAEISQKLEDQVQKVTRHLQETMGLDPEAMIADHRYGYIRSMMRQGVISLKKDLDRLFLSDRIDRILTHRLAGPLIMLAVVWGLYQFTFTYSEIPVGWLEALFGWLSLTVEVFLPESMIKSLIISGIIEGVGGVLGFVPLIMFMFLGIAFLEDSGYMARVAFMLDRVFHIFGLHGSSVMAFIVSGGIAGGCAVPGVMATRTLKSSRERLATLLTVPFMNCGAKLPVFALLVAAFFTANKAMVMFLITMGSWIGALLVAKLLRITVVKGKSTPFVMELPPYRMPTFKGLFIHTWERTRQYIRKAGTVILAISVILWALMTFPGLPDTLQQNFESQREEVTRIAKLKTDDSRSKDSLKNEMNTIDFKEAEAALRYSVAGRIGTGLEKVTQLAGFDWRTNIALVGGFAAKEVVVSSLGTAYSLGEVDPEQSDSLAMKLAESPGWRPLTAISLILFIMFYAPCFVSVVCIAREAGSWKWGAFSVLFNTLFAFTLAVTVYQTGSLLGY